MYEKVKFKNKEKEINGRRFFFVSDLEMNFKILF